MLGHHRLTVGTARSSAVRLWILMVLVRARGELDRVRLRVGASHRCHWTKVRRIELMC